MKNPFRNPYKRRGGIKPMSAEEARKRLNGEKLEKKDVPAMIIAALLTFLPALLISIGLLVGFVYWFFLR